MRTSLLSLEFIDGFLSTTLYSTLVVNGDSLTKTSLRWLESIGSGLFMAALRTLSDRGDAANKSFFRSPEFIEESSIKARITYHLVIYKYPFHP